ncbi:hypothetical protein F7725_011086 [Dissostichus mawsoni]|uniref:Uncharacterized protein n=1 Tax=Dissostichus mawsoni TaxID=36200 RepID=A0A7J5Z7Z9_DISMA|nr:hypothetical protein F7725_011086 [Dissostichus mawsoni]
MRQSLKSTTLRTLMMRTSEINDIANFDETESENEEILDFKDEKQSEVEEDQEFVYSVDEDFEDSLDLHDEEESEIKEMSDLDETESENEEILDFDDEEQSEINDIANFDETESEINDIANCDDEKQSEINDIANFDETESEINDIANFDETESEINDIANFDETESEINDIANFDDEKQSEINDIANFDETESEINDIANFDDEKQSEINDIANFDDEKQSEINDIAKFDETESEINDIANFDETESEINDIANFDETESEINDFANFDDEKQSEINHIANFDETESEINDIANFDDEKQSEINDIANFDETESEINDIANFDDEKQSEINDIANFDETESEINDIANFDDETESEITTLQTLMRQSPKSTTLRTLMRQSLKSRTLRTLMMRNKSEINDIANFDDEKPSEVEEDQEFVYSVDEDFEDSLDLHDEEESEIKEISDLDDTESENEEILEFASRQIEINEIANFDDNTESETEDILEYVEEAEEEIKEEIQEFAEEVEEYNKKQTPISSQRNYSDTSFAETEDSERSERSDKSSERYDKSSERSDKSSSRSDKSSERSDKSSSRSDKSYARSERYDKSSGLQEALDEERKAKAALEEALMKEKTSTAQHKAALKDEQQEKDALAKALKYEQDENNSLCDRIKLINAALKQSQKEPQRGKTKLKNRITIMTSELEKTRSQHQREISELIVLNTASVTAIKDRLTELQEESLKKDKDIESLHSNVLNLQSDIVAKVSIVTSLQERVNKCASDLTEEQTKSSLLQMDNEAAVSQQKKEAEELARNQHLAYENKRLQSELEALNKQHIDEKQSKINEIANFDDKTESENEEILDFNDEKPSEVEEDQEFVYSVDEDFEDSLDLHDEEESEIKEMSDLDDTESENEEILEFAAETAEELACLTQGNQHLTYENKRLQSELEAALNKQHIDEKKLQGDRRACSRLEEAIKKEEARFSRASKTIQSQEKELSEKTLALEKSLTVVKLLKSSLKSEKKRFERMVGKQASAGPISILTQQLREASAYDMQTLRMENADIRAKFLVLEREYDRERFELRSLSAGHEEMLSRKNDSISDNQFTITNLQCIVNEFKAKESKIKMRQANLEEALKQEKTRNSELHHIVDQISSSLEKERTRSFEEADHNSGGKQQIDLSLQKAQETFPRLQEKQRAETNYNFGNISDTEFRLREQKYSLDESNKALHHLQQEYTNLGRRHCDINAEYRELLKIHTALQVRHERLSNAQGNPRLDFKSETEDILEYVEEAEEEIKEEIQEFAEEVEEYNKKQTPISSQRENYSDTSFAETEDSERSERSDKSSERYDKSSERSDKSSSRSDKSSERSDKSSSRSDKSYARSERYDKSSGLQEALDEERKAKAALEEALMKEKTSTAQHKAALKDEQQEKDALAKALKYEQDENNSLCDRIKLINAALKQSQKEPQRGKTKLKNRITIMTSELEEDKKVIEKLQIDHHASSSQHQREISELIVLNTASVTAIKDRLTELQEESLKKTKTLNPCTQIDIVAKVSIVTSLQERVNKCASDLTEEQTKSSLLQMDNEAAVSQQKKEAEELARNQHLAYENKRLQSELEALNKQHIDEKQSKINEIANFDDKTESENEEILDFNDEKPSEVEEDQEFVYSVDEDFEDSLDLHDEEESEIKEMSDLDDTESENEEILEFAAETAEELACLTQGNQHLTYENKRLQSELEAALNKQHIDEKKLQGDRRACSRLEEAIKKEEARFSRASKTIQSQEKELSEKTLALEKSLTVVKLLKSSLKSEKKRFERMVGKQASAGPISILTQQLREASAYDMQTLRMENADIRAKFLVLEREYDRERFELRSLSAGHEEMLSRKNDSISDNQFTITNLQCIVNEFKAKESKIKMRQANLEEALKQEKTRNSELHHIVDQISSSLEKERTRCEKHRVELQEALKKQITTLEENNKLNLSLQKAQETFPRLQEKQRAETNYNFGNISDTEFRLREQKYSLDESNKALHHLQQEYTNLGRRHCDINAEYRELLKIHTALQVRHERLSNAQGNPRLDFSPYLFQSNCTAH